MTILCECDKCGHLANSIPDTQHRRCSGEKGKPPRDKHAKADGSVRGTWRNG